MPGSSSGCAASQASTRTHISYTLRVTAFIPTSMVVLGDGGASAGTGCETAVSDAIAGKHPRVDRERAFMHRVCHLLHASDMRRRGLTRECARRLHLHASR